MKTTAKQRADAYRRAAAAKKAKFGENAVLTRNDIVKIREAMEGADPNAMGGVPQDPNAAAAGDPNAVDAAAMGQPEGMTPELQAIIDAVHAYDAAQAAAGQGQDLTADPAAGVGPTADPNAAAAQDMLEAAVRRAKQTVQERKVNKTAGLGKMPSESEIVKGTTDARVDQAPKDITACKAKTGRLDEKMLDEAIAKAERTTDYATLLRKGILA